MNYTSPALQREMEKSWEWKRCRVFPEGGKHKGGEEEAEKRQ